MKDDIPFLIPSRGRPQSVGKLLDVWEETSSGIAKPVVVVDEDDPLQPGYMVYQDRAEVVVLRWSKGGRPPYARLVSILNFLAPEYAQDHFAVGFMDDDKRPWSGGWDLMYLRALHELGSGIVYGNDLHQEELLPTAPAITSDIIRTLGYYGPPTILHLFIDNWWKLIGETLDCIRYLPDVIIEHLHPHAGKAEIDEGYITVNDPRRWRRDEAAFNQWQIYHFPEEVQKLKTLLGRD